MSAFGGRDHYLGEYGSEASRLKYDELVAELLSGEATSGAGLNLNSILAQWWAECKRRYSKHGKGRFGNAVCWRPVIRLLREQHGLASAEDLGPAKLRRTIEEAAKADGWSLRYSRDVLSRAKARFSVGQNTKS